MKVISLVYNDNLVGSADGEKCHGLALKRATLRSVCVWFVSNFEACALLATLKRVVEACS